MILRGKHELVDRAGTLLGDYRFNFLGNDTGKVQAMKLLATAMTGIALLATPALAQSADTVPSPNQRALQKPNSSDPATTVPDSSSSSGESTGDAGYAAPPMDPDTPMNSTEPDDADPRATDSDKPKE